MKSAKPRGEANRDTVLSINGLICLWTFQEMSGQPHIADGPCPYLLKEGAGIIEQVEPDQVGPFGQYAAELKRGDYLFSPRDQCPSLNVHGEGAEITVVAWLQRHRKREVQCEAVAGMWNETRKKRQYGLFLDLRIHQAGDNVSGHVSSTGGPTPGYPWAMDAAIGSGYLTYFDWHCVGMTYDGLMVKAWLDGRLDRRAGFNPYSYPDGLFDGGPDGADFTVGAVNRGGEMGNWFVGRLGGLAVFNRALKTNEMVALSSLVPNPPGPSPTIPPVLV